MSDAKVVGVVGGGQLARMLALAAAPLGAQVLAVDPQERSPAGQVTETLRAQLDDRRAWEELARRCDVVTLEVEHIPLAASEWLSTRVPVRPGPRALQVSQDRWLEKSFLREQGIGTAPFALLDSPSDAAQAAREVGAPGIAKTRTEGYDGKGQVRVNDPSEVEAAATELARPAIYEGFVRFRRELSIVLVRGLGGELRYWPLVENRHKSGILYSTRAPAQGVRPELQREAETLGRTIAEKLDYVGVLCIELFDTEQGLLVNEMAPRVHNSGHWTIEGAVTSQFENHLRAVLGWPLGSTAAVGESLMRNCIGALPDQERVLSVAGAHLHLYGKAARPGRKLAHVTLNAPSAEALEAEDKELGDAIPFEGTPPVQTSSASSASASSTAAASRTPESPRGCPS